MPQTAEKRNNLIMRIACILLVLVVITTQLLCRIYARFIVNDSLSENSRISAFVFATRDGADSRYLDLSNIKKPGDSQTYTFSVSNHNETAVSETAISYGFTVELNGNMPIKCTITDKNNNTVLETGVLEASPVKEQAVSVGEFKPSEEKDNTYTITVQWPETVNDSSFASRNAVSEAVLTVTAQQVD